MEAKLAAYRAKKMAEKKKEEQRQKLWSWITLEGKKSVQKTAHYEHHGSALLSAMPVIKDSCVD
jgi:hypothetical protein